MFEALKLTTCCFPPLLHSLWSTAAPQVSAWSDLPEGESPEAEGTHLAARRPRAGSLTALLRGSCSGDVLQQEQAAQAI